MNRPNKKDKAHNDDNPDMPFFGQPQAKVSKRTSPSHFYKIYIDEDVREPSYYRDAIETLDEAGENDIIEVIINTNGGNLDSGCAIISAIENSEANVCGVLTGNTHSAGSMIALACPSIRVSPYATMMIHQPSFGVGNSASLVYSQVDFYKRTLDSLMRKLYKDFLTPEEIEEVLNGKEIWLDSTEIGVKLSAMFEKRSAEVEAQIEEMQKELEAIESVVEKPQRGPRKKVAAKKNV